MISKADDPAHCGAALRQHRTRQLEQRLLQGTRWHESDLIFTTSIGTPMDGPTVTRRFKAAVLKAGLPEMRFHDLRHSFASLQLALGVEARVVMESLGHSDIRLTLNVYTHVMPTLQQEAAEKLEGMLGAG